MAAPTGSDCRRSTIRRTAAGDRRQSTTHRPIAVVPAFGVCQVSQGTGSSAADRAPIRLERPDTARVRGSVSLPDPRSAAQPHPNTGREAVSGGTSVRRRRERRVPVRVSTNPVVDRSPILEVAMNNGSPSLFESRVLAGGFTLLDMAACCLPVLALAASIATLL